MKKFISIICVLCITCSMLLIFTSCSNDNGKTIVRINEVTHSVFYAPFYIAINMGFFDEEGLEIELTNGGGADKSMTAVIAGQSDIAFCGPEATIYVYNEGKDDHCVVFGQVTQCDGSFIVGRNPEENFDWENLRGKTIIGGRAGGVPLMTLQYILKQKNIIPGKDCTVIDNIAFNLMAGAFEGGEGDYVTLFEPNATQVEKAGKGYIVSSVGEALHNVPYTVFAAKQSYIKENPEIIEKFLRAFYKGQQWVASNSDEAVAKQLQPSFPTDDLDVLTNVVKNYRSINAWKDTPVMSEESFNLLQDIMANAGVIDSRVPFDKLVDNSFAEEIIK